MLSAMQSASHAAATGPARPSPALPPPPADQAATGLSTALLSELTLKHLAAAGELPIASIARRMALPVPVLEQVLAFLRTERMVEVPRRGSFDAQVHYALTDFGLAKAREAAARNSYAGVAPVSLDAYVAQLQRQSMAATRFEEAAIRAALSELVVTEDVIEAMGAALNSGRSIFLYGPSGSGKTSIAQHVVRTVASPVLIPHAVAIQDEIVRVFDPIVHRPLQQAAATGSLILERRPDERWVLAERPVVIAGGELTLDQLELQRDPQTGYYTAPPQMKANNGMLIIDDLGRQRVSPRDLLNRWIVPLDKRIDFYTLHTGAKFSLPFDASVIFSSNLAPSELGDPAFTRRFGYKLYLGAIDREGYRRVFQIACRRAGIQFDPRAEAFFTDVLHREHGTPLYATIPYDVLSKLADRARFRGGEAVLDEAGLRWAWNLYFAPDRSSDGAPTLDDRSI